MGIIDPLPIADEVYLTILLIFKIIKYWKRGLFAIKAAEFIQNKVSLIITIILSVIAVIFGVMSCIGCVSCVSCVSCDSCGSCVSCSSCGSCHSCNSCRSCCSPDEKSQSEYSGTGFDDFEKRRFEKEFSDDPKN